MKPTITVSVFCNLGPFATRESTEELRIPSNILPDYNFCHLFRKKVTLKTLEVVHAFRSCVTDKAAACVGMPPLLISFVNGIDLSVAYLIFTYAFLDLFVDSFGYCE